MREDGPVSDDLDLVAIEPWLDATLPGFAGPVRAKKYAVRQSNPTFLLEAATGAYVLRRKPAGALLKSAHAVDREFRLQRALDGNAVPVSWILALCEDESVIGSVFYVMAWVPGRNLVAPSLPDETRGARAAIVADMARVLAAIHAVDLDRTGLSDFGAPGTITIANTPAGSSSTVPQKPVRNPGWMRLSPRWSGTAPGVTGGARWFMAVFGSSIFFSLPTERRALRSSTGNLRRWGIRSPTSHRW